MTKNSKNKIQVLTIKHQRKALLYTSALIILFSFLILFIAVTNARSNKATIAHQSLQMLSSLELEFNKTYKQINKTIEPSSACNSEHIAHLRALVFASKHVKDIGYVINGKLACNSSLGKLSEAYQFRKPDIIDKNNNKFWLNESLSNFGSSQIAFIMQEKNYMLTANPSILNLDDLMPSRFEVVYISDEGIFHISGIRDFFKDHLDNATESILFKLTTIKECSADQSFCAIVRIPFSTFFSYPIMTFIALIALMIALSFLFHHLFIRYFTRLNSPISRIKRGLKNDSFFVLFQPLVDTKTGKIVGCEVLARFKDEYGDMYPDQFIPLVRQLEETWSFTIEVIINGLEGLEKLTGLPEQFGVNFNLFPLDVSTNAISKLKLIKQLSATQLNITFEITEEEYTDKATSKRNLDIIKNNGFRLALDDFGTGYSNLEQFRELGFDVIKIDRSFINNIETDSKSLTLAKHLINFAHEFNLTVVAEGVENEAQHTILKKLGVHYCQGWLFGRPMTEAQMQTLINEQK